MPTDPASMAREIAPWTWALVRATTAKPTLRARSAVASLGLHPAESARTLTARPTREASSPGRCPTLTSAGSWATAASTAASWSAMELAVALPGRKMAARASPVASAKQNMGAKPNPPL